MKSTIKYFLAYFIISLLFQYSMGQNNKPIGINISSVSDYSTELVFTDAFKQCRQWISSNASGGGPWDTGINVPLNANGYPLQIPFDDGIHAPQLVKTLMLWDIGSAVPIGNYRLIVKGNGKVRLSFGASGTYNCPLDILLPVTGQVMLEILSSEPGNPISDIKFIYPDYTDTYENQIFTTEFLTFLKDFSVIRFMDFTRTNGSQVASWADITPYSYYSQAQESGVAWEYLVRLANTTQKDIWINIPHRADDDYIIELAGLLKQTLDPGLKIYLEYSNELWNAGFSQNGDCAAFAANLGITGTPWERTWKYTAKRSADVFRIFNEVFTEDDRLIRIIPSQAANSWLTNQLITYFKDPAFNPDLVKADAVAIAPYFGGEVANVIINNHEENDVTIPEIIDRLEQSLPDAFEWIANNKEVADEHQLELICYEAGQHLVATGNNVNNTVLTNKLIAANHDSALEELYCDYMDFWYQHAGGLLCHFSSHGTYSKWGSWGIKENFQDTENPKYKALQNCVFKDNTVAVFTPENAAEDLILFPNPADQWITILLHVPASGPFVYTLFDLTGSVIQTGMLHSGERMDTSRLSNGCYLFQVQHDKGIFVKKMMLY
ncbi:MAG TPA: T9SS type A sorting domain-containing protein [Saprospiraceae bacterium]|nr:T9SS type A sorting domain-containing protein [Saprospiraceae bacterium]